MADEKRERDATDWIANEIATKAEPGVLRALARDVGASSGLSDREKNEVASGRVSPETAHKIAVNAARDLENRRRNR